MSWLIVVEFGWCSDSCLGRWGAEDGVGVLLDVDGEQDLLQVLKTGKIQSMSDDMILNSGQKKTKKAKRDERCRLHAGLGVHVLSITLEVHHLDKASNFTAIIFCYKSSHNHVIVLYSSLHTNIFRSVVTSMKKSVITVSTVFTLSMSFAIGPWKLYNCCSPFQLFANIFQSGFLGPETLRLEARAG